MHNGQHVRRGDQELGSADPVTLRMKFDEEHDYTIVISSKDLKSV